MTERFRRTAAAAEPAAGLGTTWRDLLWDAGAELRDADDPSQALLSTTDALLGGVRAHASSLPERARRHWLEETLGIAALPMVPDEVVVVATADPMPVPPVLAAGTELRAAKGESVPERTYVTTDTLTVLGATFEGVHGYVAESWDDWATYSADLAEPLAPFPPREDEEHVAEHRIDFVTDEIAFAEGDAEVSLTFEGGAKVSSLSGATWQYSTKDGLRVAAATVSGNTVSLTLDGGCGPCDLDGEQRTFLRVTIPGDEMTSERYALAFTKVLVSVTRTGVPADGAYYNNGALDVTKEFKPFGPVPRRGDAFYVRSDEAFSRDLRSVAVRVDLSEGERPKIDASVSTIELAAAIAEAVLDLYGIQGAARGTLRGAVTTAVTAQLTPITSKGGADAVGEIVAAVTDAMSGTLATTVGKAAPARTTAKARIRTTIEEYLGGKKTKGTTDPTLSWERRGASAWDAIGSARRKDFDLVRTSRTTASARTEVAGTPGHFLRLRIASGDFGWDAYLLNIAQFAAEAADPTKTPAASLLKEPTPPMASSVTITYTTADVPVDEVRARNQPATGHPTSPEHLPFRQPVSGREGRAGMVAFGFGVAAGLRGSTLAWYAHVAQAPACESAGRTHDATWEYWSESGAWEPVDVLDGTRGLRQSGLVRLVTPKDWAESCTDVGAATGRWLRIVTATPDFVGDLLAVHTDAMTARYRAPGTPDDVAPLTPLVPKQVKGLRTPVPGVKVTNPLPGTPGRAAEDAERYRARAGSVVRHRNRAIQAWDYETLVTTEFPEVAVARCLPHADADDCSRPGSVGIVVLPRSTERMPYPSVALADRIAATLRPRVPVHANVVVLCPEYVGIRFSASIVLRRGVAAAEARTRILDAVERRLHPLSGTEGAPFGQSLYPSSLVAFLESLADVDHVDAFALLSPAIPGDVVEVDACKGLIASGGDHLLELEEQL